MSATASAPVTGDLPTRSGTVMTKSSTLSDEDAVPAEDTSEVTKLFSERLQAWKHACGYLEDYIKATEKMHHSHGKEYEKVLKTVSNPLKEGHHFDQNLGGVAGMFESIRSNTTGIANANFETEKVLKGTVLPIFERLHAEIKNKTKELTKGAGKGAKSVDKARNVTQKHIELLGQQAAAFDSTGGKVHAHEDPYLLHRGVRHRLNKQIIEENNNRQDMIQVQNSFAQFEAHVLQTIQHGMGQFNQVVAKQMDQTKIMYGDMTSTAQQIPADFEWNGFVHRNSDILIDPQAPPRSLATVSFPNQDHPSTQPLIAGSLERKSKLTRSYKAAYYVVTPSKYLHEFETDDDLAKDPTPENSLYLPDCVVGALDGAKFAIKGKDVSKGKLGVNISTTHEYQLKAHTPADAQTWYNIIRAAAGQVTTELPDASVPTSPVSPNVQTSQDASLNAALAEQKHQQSALTTEGIATTDNVAGTTPATAAPAGATTTAPAAGTVPVATTVPAGTAVSTSTAVPATTTTVPATTNVPTTTAPTTATMPEKI
ncbi:uncharacterized protein PV09_04613 [Verruconis gallopava]|uniref:PH domain-containing protein n=1 Tax=Verruconis gallopava TaxID=253628 RepID=A0A0D1XP15_9PEZI|nr:uncharacterized protein PV09_04613 [Verruconis gallopava]KIW04321.1 hypothetical protein PV09_04613 [Verruconis gallopava]